MSEHYNIPLTTISTRIRILNLKVKKINRRYELTDEQVEKILTCCQAQYHGLINRNINRTLLFDFRMNYPFLSKKEIAEALAININLVNYYLDNEIVIPSKLNFM